MNAVQQIMNAIFDFQRNVVYPEAAINRARGLVGQVMGIYGNIRGIWATVVRSATLASPRSLRDDHPLEEPGPDWQRRREFLERLHALAASHGSAQLAAGSDR